MYANITTVSPDFDAIVLELGSFYLKGGFSDEARPRFITPFVSSGLKLEGNDSTNTEEIRTWPLFGGSRVAPDGTCRDRLRSSLRTAFSRLLMVDATQRKVVLATNGMKTNRDLEQMVEDVLLGDLRVPSVKIVDGNAASVLAHGKAHGLVVDCGFWETSCVPVYDYTPLFSYATCVSLGGNAVNQELAAVRDPPGHPMAADSLKFSIIADPDSTEQQDVAFNVLFKGDEDGRSITDAILSTLLECPVDIRKPLASTIILTGSLTGVVGFEERLLLDLKSSLKKPEYSRIAHLSTALRICSSSFPPNTVAWVGTSLYASSVK